MKKTIRNFRCKSYCMGLLYGQHPQVKYDKIHVRCRCLKSFLAEIKLFLYISGFYFLV